MAQSHESNNLLRRVIDEILNNGRLEMVDVLFHPDFRDPDVFPGEPIGTRESFKQFVQETREAMPDFHFEPLQPERVFGDEIWGRYKASGTMTGGPLFGKPATGQFAEWAEIHWVRVDAATGQIIDHFGAGADLSMLVQLGLMPPLQPTTSSEEENSPGAQ